MEVGIVREKLAQTSAEMLGAPRGAPNVSVFAVALFEVETAAQSATAA